MTDTWVELTLDNGYPIMVQLAEAYHFTGDPLLTKAYENANCIIMFSSGAISVRETYDEIKQKLTEQT